MRYITPETVMRERFGRNPRPRWDVAVLCFRTWGGSRLLLKELGAKPLGYKVLWGMDESAESPYAHEVAFGEKRAGVIAQCQWGGPQAAIVVEELAHLGVKTLIGIGAAGGIAPGLPRGAQVLALSSLVTDGTSRAYTDQDEVHADPGLRSWVESLQGNGAWRLRPVRMATVDAIYRETHSLIGDLAGRGVEAINMETAPFYAASAVCGVRSVWIGHVSDSLVEGKWEAWDSLEEMTCASGKIGLGIVRAALKMGDG